MIGLSKGKRFPENVSAAESEITAISKLRNALNNLTGLSGDPFIKFSKDVGWKTRFKLIDDRRNADIRAKNESPHEEFNEDKHSPTTRDYDTEDDNAGRFIGEPER